jgi:hypothetical protein
MEPIARLWPGDSRSLEPPNHAWKSRLALDRSILEAALVGLEAQHQRIEEQIAQVRSRISGRGGGATPMLAGVAKRTRKLSAAARKRIAAAQKKRWAEFRKQKAAAAKK